MNEEGQKGKTNEDMPNSPQIPSNLSENSQTFAPNETRTYQTCNFPEQEIGPNTEEIERTKKIQPTHES